MHLNALHQDQEFLHSYCTFTILKQMFKLLNLKYTFQNHGTLTLNNVNGFCFFVILPSNICSENMYCKFGEYKIRKGKIALWQQKNE